MTFHFHAVRLGILGLCVSAFAAEPPAPSASELAARLIAKQTGTSYVRVRMATSGSDKNVLQLQIKSRTSRASTELVYQVLFPKERKGEAVLLRRSGGQFSGTLFTPPNTVRTLRREHFGEPLLGSELSYEDVIDNFFAWEQQTLVGHETVDRTDCLILESKPGKSHRSSYTSVRTWLDPRRLVPLRIEKYGEGGKPTRRIVTTRVLLDGDDSLPANLSISGPSGTVTEIDGSRIKRGVTFGESEFTAEGIKNLTIPRGATLE